MLEELLKRSECRIACRRLGIIEVRKSGSHVLLFSAAIDKVKWEGLKRSIPKVEYNDHHYYCHNCYHRIVVIIVVIIILIISLLLVLLFSS